MPDTALSTNDDPSAGSRHDASFLHLEGISKSFGNGADAVQIVAPTDVRISRGQFVSLLGPSGCGKSTILSIIAGLVEPSDGFLWLDRRPIDGPGADRGVVFQQHVLLPWMSARENVEFALSCARPALGASARAEVTDHYLDLVHLGHAKDRLPGQLSGGMQQRVGIARAFSLEPKVLLLDEPFGALDALTRHSLQRELLRLWEADRRTVVMVTHDVDEAIALSDRILVMNHGPDATVTRDISVPFDRPRDPDTLPDEAAYRELRTSLLDSLTRDETTGDAA
ncbi:ABC transporter ATP-binding protein [Dietzia kunjamensis]|uniref:ABC transporter ATP-binding protein n=1 Tax=Dietzia TaxID=37914 RepID=UPI0022B4B51D|nr:MULTISPECIES: ABC transporter ATP-binding protein [Dietzia]MCZ4541341.1 ABC transporter ATP-binding protein [Dietzia maris]MDJ0423854.1 ABC transporter ATP-binding protein [Dietzia kunjamensis]